MATSHAYVILTQPQRRRICQTRRTKEWISTTVHHAQLPGNSVHRNDQRLI